MDYFDCGLNMIAGVLHCLSPELVPSRLCSMVLYSFSWAYELRLTSARRTMRAIADISEVFDKIKFSSLYLNFVVLCFSACIVLSEYHDYSVYLTSHLQ